MVKINYSSEGTSNTFVTDEATHLKLRISSTKLEENRTAMWADVDGVAEAQFYLDNGTLYIKVIVDGEVTLITKKIYNTEKIN